LSTVSSEISIHQTKTDLPSQNNVLFSHNLLLGENYTSIVVDLAITGWMKRSKEPQQQCKLLASGQSSGSNATHDFSLRFSFLSDP